MNWLTQFLTQIFAPGAAIVAFVFLGQLLIKRIFNHDLERFKADLQRTAREHDVLFQSLHAQRAEAIRDLYRKVCTLRKAAVRYADRQDSSGQEDHEANRRRVENAANELGQAMLDARIFLPEELCVKIQDGVERVCRFGANIAGEVFSFPGKSVEQQFAITLKNKEALKEAAWETETELTNEFRRIFRVG